MGSILASSNSFIQKLEKFDAQKHFLTTDLKIQNKNLGTRILRFFFPHKYTPSKVALNLIKKVGICGLSSLEGNDGYQRFCSKMQNNKSSFSVRIRNEFRPVTVITHNEASLALRIFSNAKTILESLKNQTHQSQRNYEALLLNKIQRSSPSPSRPASSVINSSLSRRSISQNSHQTYAQLSHVLTTTCSERRQH